MSEITREIASQPDCWAEAAALAPEVGGLLPTRGERVAVVGCGTSFFVAGAFADLREAGGHGETDAFAASEFPLGRRYDRVVAISRSGTTTEVVRLLERIGDAAPTVAIGAVGDSPVVARARERILLPFADERSVVQTRFATSVLALVRAHLGEDLTSAIEDARAAASDEIPIRVLSYDHFVFLGHGWTVGLADEAALKMREAAQARSESYPAMEYRHGPISLAGTRSLVWILGSEDGDVADDVRATGATVRIAERDPMAELVWIQRSAAALAEARGLDPDHPRHLTRSVVLTSSDGGAS